MAPLLRRQPFKTIYILAFLVVMVSIQLPCWLTYYSRRSNRPRKTWTLQRTIGIRMIRRLGQLPLIVGLLNNRDLSSEVPQKELESFNARFVWVPELEKEDVVGIVEKHAMRAGIKSVAIPAYWILKDGAKWSPEYEKARKDEKVILYLHGGAFVMGTAHPSHITASTPRGIIQNSESFSRALSVDYRLSSGPPLESKNPFPAAVIDAIAAYKYLVCELGFLPQNIIVGGDSAGGNLALALARYVIETRFPHLPPPGGLLLSSPLTDMSFSRSKTGSSHFLNSESDIFDPPRDLFTYMVDAYIGEMDSDETKYNKYLSPISEFVVSANADEDGKLFSGFPRSYIMGGGAEAMFDDIVALAERMKDDGVDVVTDFPPDAVHGYPMFSWHEPERTETFVKCAAWLDERREAIAVL